MSHSVSLLRPLALFCSLALALSSAAQAQDANPPYIARPLQNITVPLGTATTKVNLKKTFGLTNVSQEVVRFATTLGNIDVELRPDVAPATVANFLGYVGRGDYNGSFLHRSIANFVVQGGGYTYNNDEVQTIPTQPPVVNEFKLSNLRGTLAMAKIGSDPNSATDQWFFSETDNSSNLDNQNGGFTVFGSIIGAGLNVLDTIAAVPTVNAGGAFDNLPVVNYTSGANVARDNLVFVNSITPIPLVPKKEGDAALLKLTVKNTNPGLLTATLNGKKLILTYVPGAKGSATIKLVAKDAAKGKVKTSFLVTVE